MNETMKWLLSTWQSYWADGYHQYLLLVSALYLLIWKRKKGAARHLLSYMAVVLFVFFCPVTAEIIKKCIGGSVYWRVLWLLPMVPLVAYAGAELVRERKKSAVQAVLVVALFGLIAFCGKSVWQAGNYEKVNNYQQVPDEVAQICSLINEDRGGGDARLATDDFVASYARVYDASIAMPYGRGGRGVRSKKSRLLYQEMVSPAPDYEKIARLAKNRKCNYLAVSLPGAAEQAAIEKFGYRLTGMVNQYGVFALEN